VKACDDAAVLEQWLRRAAPSHSIDAVFLDGA